MDLWTRLLLLLSLMLPMGCSEAAPPPPPSTRDATLDGRVDGAPDAHVDSSPEDASAVDAHVDAAERCDAWALSEFATMGIGHTEPVAPNSLRSTRIWLRVLRSGCDEPAMPRVELDEETRTARIAHRVWSPIGVPPCDAPSITEDRPVVLRLPTPGRWTIVDDAPDGSAMTTINVEAPPERPCRSGASCDLDCDCADMPGAVCLSSNGFGGPISSCVRPCEVDRDCLGFARCVDVADYFVRYCAEGRPECADASDCPSGFRCDGGACSPDFRLSGATRGTCTCNDDCDDGLSCVQPPGAAVGRCEVRCLTGGEGWCPGSHRCGERTEDISGLAVENATCGYVGE